VSGFVVELLDGILSGGSLRLCERVPYLRFAGWAGRGGAIRVVGSIGSVGPAARAAAALCRIVLFLYADTTRESGHGPCDPEPFQCFPAVHCHSERRKKE